MKLTRAADYGIRALVYLAGQPPDKVCLISDISSSQNIPEKFLAKIMQILTKGGIVKSFRGVKGGFSLARAPKDINLRQVIECLEEKIALNVCLISHKACDRSCECPVHPVWIEAQAKLVEVLEASSLESLAEREKKNRN